MHLVLGTRLFIQFLKLVVADRCDDLLFGIISLE